MAPFLWCPLQVESSHRLTCNPTGPLSIRIVNLLRRVGCRALQLFHLPGPPYHQRPRRHLPMPSSAKKRARRDNATADADPCARSAESRPSAIRQLDAAIDCGRG